MREIGDWAMKRFCGDGYFEECGIISFVGGCSYFEVGEGLVLFSESNVDGLSLDIVFSGCLG